MKKGRGRKEKGEKGENGGERRKNGGERRENRWSKKLEKVEGELRTRPPVPLPDSSPCDIIRLLIRGRI